MSGFEWGRFVTSLLLILLLPATAWAAAPANQLANHPSPYLALHGNDPVAWQEWNADTLARARRENKLLFVSVGYFACHWCHVMQRESYKNPQIAAILNRDFIPVKVDRELNSGLDDALQNFSARLTGASGWPLNAFITPEGHPAYVILYAPPDDFRKLLSQLSGRWAAELHDLIGDAETLTVDISGPADLLERIWETYLERRSATMGGPIPVVRFSTGPTTDVRITIDDSIVESRLFEWIGRTMEAVG